MMQFCLLISLLISNKVASIEFSNVTSSSKSRKLELEDFYRIINSESPHKILRSSAPKKGKKDTFINGYNNNNFKEKVSFYGANSKKEEDEIESSYVLCDSNQRRTGGERKKTLMKTGIDQDSITTILNNEERSCYIVYVPEKKILKLSQFYHVLPLSYKMKIRSQTVDRISDEDRTSPIIIETLNFKGKGAVGYSAAPASMKFREKVMRYTKNDILTQTIFQVNNSRKNNYDNRRSRRLSDNEETMEEVTYLCEESYDYLFFSSIDEKLVRNLSKMQINAKEMEEFILTNFEQLTEFNNKTEAVTAKEVFETCIMTLIMSMSLLPEVCSIEVKPQYKLFNDNVQYLVQSFQKDQYPWYDVGLNGEGEVIALSDAGIDVDNCYFWDSVNTLIPGSDIDFNNRKIVFYDDYADAGDLDYGHGTHVAGTLCGRRSLDGVHESEGLADGVAYGSKLAFLDIGDRFYNIKIPSVDRILSIGRPYAKIHSASWGIDNGEYDNRAAQIDSYLYQNDDFVFVVASGNSGKNNKFSTIASPAIAKNVIAVGASETDATDMNSDMLGPSYVAAFSSKGPTPDGRTKPDIIAPGYWIISAGSQSKKVGECDPIDGFSPKDDFEGKDGILTMGGTSQSTPVVSGVLALIRQYFRDGFYPSGVRKASDSLSPSGALLKAVLLNGGQALLGVNNKNNNPPIKPDVYPSEPYDNIQNFGRVSLVDSLYVKGRSNVNAVIFDRVNIKEGETKMFPVRIYNLGWCKSSELSVTLVWMDKPGFTNCIDTCLINDLDLVVIKANDPSRKYYPNGGTSKDYKNTVERVRVSNLQNNEELRVYVRAANFDAFDEHQSFAIVAAGCIRDRNNSPNTSSPTPNPTNNPTKKPVMITQSPSRSREKYDKSTTPIAIIPVNPGRMPRNPKFPTWEKERYKQGDKTWKKNDNKYRENSKYRERYSGFFSAKESKQRWQGFP